MRKQLLVLALVTISIFESFAQIIFENGYFIDEANNKIECLIKNIDWKDNPKAFDYKLFQNDTVYKASIQTVKEFGINNVSKFIRARTEIDRSSDQADKLSSERNPNFREELLFLKVLIEGEASLFVYIDANLTRFFYRINDSEINQLVYKRFQIDGKIFENSYFKQQLFLQLTCDEIGLNDIKHLKYSKRDLEKLFKKYNECIGSEYFNHDPKGRKDFFNITIRPGINYSSLKIRNPLTRLDEIDLGGDVGIRFGIEAEYILPFNKNKWGILIEPTYQYYKAEHSMETNSFSGGILVTKVDYKSIELPVSVRHYFYLNDQSTLFANISYVFDISYNSSIKFFRNDNSMISELEVLSRRNLALGIGYKYKTRYSIEMRYNTNREILSDYLSWSSNYNSLNVMFGISIF